MYIMKHIKTVSVQKAIVGTARGAIQQLIDGILGIFDSILGAVKSPWGRY